MADYGGGGGGGGGVGGAGPNYQAMIDYLEGSRSSVVQPFVDAEQRLASVYGDSQRRMGEAQQAMLARLAAGGAEQQRIAADRDAALERSAATYNPQAVAALQGLLRDLGAQGAPTAPLDAVAAMRGAQSADLGARDQALRAQLDAAMRTRLAAYQAANDQQNAASAAALELARSGAASGIAQRRAAAEATLNQKIAELRAR